MDPRPQDLAQRAADLAGFMSLLDGFGLFLLISPGAAETARFCALLVDALGPGWSLARLDPYADPSGPLPAVSHERLVETVGQVLVDGALPGAGARVVLVDGTDARDPDRRTWDLFFSWLNRNRNLVVRHTQHPLLIAVTRRMYVKLAEMAPDLWSVRSDVVEIEARPLEPMVEARLSFGADLDERAEEAPAPPSGAFRSGGRLVVPALAELLSELFAADELRRFLASMPEGQALYAELPGQLASTAQVAEAAAHLLHRRGRLDGRLFERLVAARPRREREIAEVARIAGAPLEARRLDASEALRSAHEPTLAAPAPPEAPIPAAWPHEPAIIVLASFNPEETLPDRPNHLRLYQPEEAADHHNWELYFGGALTRYRERLSSRGVGPVLLHPVCAPSVALRAGGVFHTFSGLRLSSTQWDAESGQSAVWDLDPPAPIRPRLAARRSSDPAPTELHLTVSASTSVRSAWERWRFQARVAAFALHVEPASGPSRASVPDGAAASGWAMEIRALLLTAPIRATVLRIFFAGPSALAVAIGRVLRFDGVVILMDYDRRTETYVESFRFETEA